MRAALFALGLFAGAASAQADGVASETGLDGFVTFDRLPVPTHAALARGGQVWAKNCQNCHGGNKLTGAPKITAIRPWADRIAQGMDTLIVHATEGFIGPKYTQMPARGGNSDLSDRDVAWAVAFMVWASGGAETALAYVGENHSEGVTK